MAESNRETSLNVSVNNYVIYLATHQAESNREISLNVLVNNYVIYRNRTEKHKS